MRLAAVGKRYGPRQPWVAGISPANAALRQAGSAQHPVTGSAVVPLIVAIALLAGPWALSAVLAARRGA